mgnify:CR=1 FL=1
MAALFVGAPMGAHALEDTDARRAILELRKQLGDAVFPAELVDERRRDVEHRRYLGLDEDGLRELVEELGLSITPMRGSAVTSKSSG